MRVMFFLEPFPVRNRPLDFQWILDRWLAVAKGLKARGADYLFVVSDAIAEANQGLIGAVSPRSRGFEYVPPAAEAQIDREWVTLMEKADSAWAPFVHGVVESFRPEVIVAWTVNAPLKAAAEKQGAALLHQEAGPIRFPNFTLYYCDPVGVNGLNSVHSLWPELLKQPLTGKDESDLNAFFKEFLPAPQHSREELARLLPLEQGKPVLAVFLQVARDSNVLAWSHVSGNVGLLELLSKSVDLKRQQVWVKAHPGDPHSAVAVEQLGFHRIPASVPSLDVIPYADAVMTMNSSVGVEGLMHGKSVYTFGKSLYSGLGCTRDFGDDAGLLARALGDASFVQTGEEVQRSRRLLHFLIFQYLVPEAELFDPDLFGARLQRARALQTRGAPLSKWFPEEGPERRLQAFRMQRALAVAANQLLEVKEQNARLDERLAKQGGFATLQRESPPRVARDSTKALTRGVCVIVPIYNGYEDFQQLVNSLFSAYPAPAQHLRFLFVDDASTDTRVAELLGSSVFERPDVRVVRQAVNKGFIHTVNAGLKLAEHNGAPSDVVILNSDVEVHGSVFETLQDVAYRFPAVASVTPVCNNATIASLWKWPEGAALPPGLTPALVSETVAQAGVSTPYVGAPTGVGFCMYMTSEALRAVGGFDPIFGKGYGEENHWCQIASKKGFINVLTPETFVFHRGSASFSNEARLAHIESNLKILGKIHPGYLGQVADYIRTDPLRAERFKLLWALRRKKKSQENLQTTLMILHSNPEFFGGGTERHVMGLTDALLKTGQSEVLHLSPNGDGTLTLTAYCRGTEASPRAVFLRETFNEEAALALLRIIAAEVDTLHVHHFLNWPEWFSSVPDLFSHATRLLTLHDYYVACPSVRMVSHGRFCGVPKDLTTCNECLVRQHHYRDQRIQEYRRTNAEFLFRFDRVLTPSAAAKTTLLTAFEVVDTEPGSTLMKRLDRKIEVLPNFLFHVPELVQTRMQEPKPVADVARSRPRVIHLGAFSESKGALLFAEAAPALLENGYEVEVWGGVDVPIPHGVTHRTYKSNEELRALGRKYPVSVVVVSSVWPETFSFTAFESVLDLRSPLVVGPYGNPPEVVQQYKLGAVVDDLTGRAVVKAVERCLERGPRFTAPEAFLKYCASLTVESYLTLLGRPASTLAAAPLRPLSELPSPKSGPSQAVRFVVPAAAQEPLRYRIADDTNSLLKARLPRLHAAGKWLVATTMILKEAGRSGRWMEDLSRKFTKPFGKRARFKAR